MRLPGFIGPSNPSRSGHVSLERTINLYPEVVDGGSGPSEPIMRGRPAVTPYTCLPGGPVRALWSEDGRCFGVGGDRFYEVLANRTSIARGVMAPDANPATISSNGTAGYQVLTTSGGRGYRFDLRHNRFAQITDPDLPRPLTMAAFVDGYFVGLRGNTRQFKISSLENGTSWDGLDLGEVSTSSDNLRAMVVLQRQLWLMGSKNTTVWYNNGASNFPFAPYGGAQIEHGILAPWSAVVLDNTIYYIGQDAHGRGQVWRMNGYTPVVVSTHAVQHQLGKSARLAEAVAWAMEYEKHLWYALYVPDLPTTWLFDVSTNAWMEWGVWDPDRANWRPFPARCHTCFNGQHLVGDPSTGAIYAVDLEVAEDTLVEAA